MARNKRRKVLTHSSLQLRLFGVFVFWTIVLVICLFGLFFMSYVKVAQLASGDSQQELMLRVLAVEMSGTIATYFGIAMLLFVALMAIHVISFSHRLTGPVFKLTQILERSIQNKEYPGTIRFRKHDAFQDTARVINEFIEASKNRELK